MNKIGLTIAACSALFMGWFMWSEYTTSAVYGHGYTKETMARMDDLIAGLTPLTTADLGE